jgi:hypothetical protein
LQIGAEGDNLKEKDIFFVVFALAEHITIIFAAKSD